MKSKFLISSLLLSLIVTSSCDMLKPKDKYQLKDTWGADGNWGKATKLAKNNHTKSVSHKEVTHKTPVTHKETVHNEIPVTHKETGSKPKEELKQPVNKETPEHNEKKEPANTENKPSSAYDNDDYSVIPAAGTNQKDMVNAFYVKKKDVDNSNFSVGAIKSLNASDLNGKFKEAYLKHLKESFTNFEIIYTKDENIKGQKAWALNYTFEQNGKKLQQKQVFLPHKNNTLLLNCIESVEAFSSCEKDFDDISKNLKLK